MGSGIFGIALSGLNAAQSGLVTTGHNIANASTPGYHRQRIEQASSIPQPTGNGFFGTGVDVSTVRRIYSDFLDTQVVQAQGRLSYLEGYQAQIAQIDNLLADQNAGLTPAIQGFFDAVHDVAADPSSVASRQAMLSGAQSLVGRFRTLDERFTEMQSAVNSQVRDAVTAVNGLASQIATLNQRILESESGGGRTHAANDLLDQRDAVIAQLNELAGTTTISQTDGTVNVMIGSGQNLVVGSRVMTLAAVPSPEDAERLEVGYNVGGSVAIISESLSGGRLGGVLAFRRDTLEPTMNSVGRIAIALADSFNDQHRLGQDLTGALGGDFFTVPGATVFGKTTNAGSGIVAATLADPALLTGSDYRVSYGAGGYTVVRLADGNVQTFAALPQTVDGVTLALTSGTPVAGDSFLVRPTRAGARAIALELTSAADIAAAAPMRTASGAGNTGTGAISAGVVNGPPPPSVNLQQTVTIQFTGPGTFNVTGTGTGNPTGVAYTAGAPITFNGWTVNITGAPRAGDTFTVGANVSGVSDNRNALLLAGLQTRSTIGNGSATYQSAYSQTVASIGARARELNVSVAAQTSLVQQTEATQQGLSGVNLDEEAANLIRYQQAYQASGKMIEIASRLFESLLAI